MAFIILCAIKKEEKILTDTHNKPPTATLAAQNGNASYPDPVWLHWGGAYLDLPLSQLQISRVFPH